MNGYSINGAQADAARAVLDDLVVQAEADAAFVSDQRGNTIAHVSAASDDSLASIAALAAGSFCATRELAGLLGETAFASTFHHGRKHGIFMQSMPPDFLLLVVFGRRTQPGLVKLYVERAAEELEPLLGEIRAGADGAAGQGHRFELDPDVDVFDVGARGAV